jgi:hypothetical protein
MVGLLSGHRNGHIAAFSRVPPFRPSFSPEPNRAFELSPALSQSFCVARSRGTHFVVTANTTIEGSAVYLRADGSWAPRLADAWPIEREVDRDAAIEVARTQERHVCDPYAFKVVVSPHGPTATNTREQIRGHGPTIALRRPDPAPTAFLGA